jgi:hypothetical protein
MRAKARQHKPGVINKNEAAYARDLERRQRAREIVHYRFEPVKYRLADLAFCLRIVVNRRRSRQNWKKLRQRGCRWRLLAQCRAGRARSLRFDS